MELQAAMIIQTWWRGHLVRRTLLHAALQAWTVQCWWRLWARHWQKEWRLSVLVNYIRQERAAVQLQSLVRMWRFRKLFCRTRSAACLIQNSWRDWVHQGLLLRHYQLSPTSMELDIEIQLKSP
ncbi:IQ domain-containing protein F6 [Ornithorhynchus anatinus]|nr:IQ domain-containing protein F6 [Ornithorhynchus anatinus]